MSETPALAAAARVRSAATRLPPGRLRRVGTFYYMVVPREGGWAYRLENKFSPVLPTDVAAVEAAKFAAMRMDESGDDTQVRASAMTCNGAPNGCTAWVSNPSLLGLHGPLQTEAAPAAARELAQEGGPEGLRLRGADVHAQHLAPPIAIDHDRDDDGNRDNAAAWRTFT